MAILTEDDFKGHIMIVGSTGAGKSNLLLYIMQYLASKGATIISFDPHGDLALEQKGTIPQTQVFDPVLAPFVLNPMDIGPYSNSVEKRVLVQRRVGELVDMMKDLFGVEQTRAPRLLWIFRGLLYYLYSISDTPTFLDLYFLLSDLLTEPSKIKRLMQGSDEVIRKSAEAMAELEPTAFTAVMNMISNFVMPAHSYTSRTFCARKTTVDFLSLTEPGKITAFRVARNQLPDDFRRVITATIILNVFFAVAEKSATNVYGGLFGATVAGTAIGLLLGGYAVFYEQMKGEKIVLPKVKRVKEKKKNPFIVRISKKVFLGNKVDILAAGIPETPSMFYYKWATYFFYSIIVSIPVAFALAFILKSLLPLLLMMAPLVVLLGPNFQLSSNKGDRKRAMSDELPFFTLYAATLADAGVSLYDAFKKLIGTGIFKRIKNDALYLVRAVEFLGQDHMTAMDTLARIHPSKELSDLLYGYTSEIRSGGDTAGFLMDRAGEMLDWLEFRFTKYGDSVSDIGEMLTALFFILPTLILAMAFVSPSTATSIVWLVNALVIPIIGVAIIFQIKGMQPKSLDIYRGNLMTGILAGAITAAIIFFLKVPLWAIAASGTIAGIMAYSVNVFFQKRVADEEEKGLEPFMRDLTEYRKTGYTIQRAIERLANEAKYPASFMDTLKSISGKMKLGFRLSDLRVGNSWIGRQIFFLLGQIEDTGGGLQRRNFGLLHPYQK